jgi:hypothetical protein
MEVEMTRYSPIIDAHVESLQKSGLTVAEYSRRNGISRWTLYERLHRERKKAKAIIPAHKLPSTTFTELPGIFTGSSTIHLRFPTGIQVILSSGFDLIDLRNLVAGLSISQETGKSC